MTEKLKTLMHEQASRPEFDVPDVELLVRAGASRTRRRRYAVVTGGVAAAVVAGTLAVVVTGGDDRAVDPADDAATTPLTWARGSTLHVGDRALDLGHPIDSYVRTTVGYVFADDAGKVFSAVDGEVTRVGDIAEERPHLVADGDGPLVAWVDPEEGADTFVVLDQGTGSRTVHGGEAGPAHLLALDGRTAYWLDSRGAVALDLDSDETRVVEADALDGDVILAAEDGVLAFDAVDGGVSVGTSRDDAVTLPDSYAARAIFSPRATYISVDADEPLVYEVSTGRRLDIDVDGRWFATGYEWLDDDTLAMISAEDEQDPADLLTCDVPDGVCEVAIADLGTFEELTRDLALPVGTPLED